MNVYTYLPQFLGLFGGLDAGKLAFGTGKGQWIKRPLTAMDVADHLAGKGPGIGLPPLRPDNNVVFAAIDLDEPNFELAHDLQTWIPGPSYIERSRSGNAHVWVFFREPLEAWVAMGILKDALKTEGRTDVEVFPKNHDFSRVKLGNYINLPYHGQDRPILWPADSRTPPDPERAMMLEGFLNVVDKNDPEKWRSMAKWKLLSPPEVREASTDPRTTLHVCAEHIMDGILSGERPIFEGHRSAVFFALSSQLRQWEGMDDDEALSLLQECNSACPDPLDGRELLRIFNNAGEFRSTRCDDPLVRPFTHPDCPIARSDS